MQLLLLAQLHVLVEELLALGHEGAEYDAYLIKINEGDQFGSGFVDANPNSKIPAMVDHSGDKPVRVFESASILLYLLHKRRLALQLDHEQGPHGGRVVLGVPALVLQREDGSPGEVQQHRH